MDEKLSKPLQSFLLICFEKLREISNRPVQQESLMLEAKSHIILIEIQKGVLYLKKNSQRP